MNLPGGYQAVRAIDEQANLGPVWLAERRGVRVALKLVPYVYVNPKAHNEILSGWRALARVRADGLVGFVEGGLEPHWAASELVEGAGTLEEELRAGTPVMVRALEIATQAAAGLATLHAEGHFHGTLEAHDLLLNETPAAPPLVRVNNTWMRALLFRPPEERRMVMDGGPPPRTVAYISPEAAAAKPLGPAADVYALGAILYECLAGRPPFPHESMTAVLYAHLKEEPAPLPAAVPPRLASLVMSMLGKLPEERPTMAEAARALLTSSGA